MDRSVTALTVSGPVSGTIDAIASKSHVHRLLMAAALSDSPTVIRCRTTSADIEATRNVLAALGATFRVTPGAIEVMPVRELVRESTLDCSESGTTLRFMLPIVAALGSNSSFMAHGRLPSRPLSPLYEELERHGIRLSAQGAVPLDVRGKLSCGDYTIAANVSSQFVGGLLFALSLLEGKSTLTLTETIESLPYTVMTLEVLKLFGARISASEDMRRFEIEGASRLRSPGTVVAEGDWSNAAFWLCAGALGGGCRVGNLNLDSVQGDKAVLRILSAFGAKVTCKDGLVKVTSDTLKATRIDARHIPDLVPVLAVVAGAACGTTVFENIQRLRVKESDRVETTIALLRSLGVNAASDETTLTVKGRGGFLSGEISGFNDHRIVMAAAVASLNTPEGMTITAPTAVNKSYPQFFEDWQGMGGRVVVLSQEKKGKK